MKKLIQYSKQEKSQIKKQLEIIFSRNLKNASFWQALDAVFANDYINSLIQSKGADSLNQKISAGTSVKNAPNLLLRFLTKSILSDNYRFYTPSAGSIRARKAIAIRESVAADLNTQIGAGDVVITTGSTGAISSVFEYIREKYPKGKVLISSPTYYLYPFCASYYRLKSQEVSINGDENVSQKSFLCFDLLLSSINEETKLICIVNPTNPSGEYYSLPQLEQLLIKAKKFGAMVLVDELFNFLDYENIPNRIPSLKAAEIARAEENLIVVNGYSKALNLAGMRVGYLLTQNADLRDSIVRINEVRNCFPIGYQYDELIEIDGLLRVANIFYKKYGNLNQAIRNSASLFGLNIPIKTVLKYYREYWKSVNQTIESYKKQLDEATKSLANSTQTYIEPMAGFNSVIKLATKKQYNQMDFAINCYLATGVKIQIGPCFGLSQNEWQKEYGLWLRLTTAREPSIYEVSLESLKLFISEYEKGWGVLKTEFIIKP